MSDQRHPAGPVLAISGTAMQLGTAIALLPMFPNLQHAFAKLGESGIGDPTGLAAGVNEMLIASAFGLGLSVIGLALLCVALVGARYRAVWFRWFLSVYTVFLLVAFPVGTAFGIFFLFYTFRHQQEFGSTPAYVLDS